jgi:hypothetical protein
MNKLLNTVLLAFTLGFSSSSFASVVTDSVEQETTIVLFTLGLLCLGLARRRIQQA